MFERHLFVASTLPDPYQVHCLVAHLTDKRPVVPKVELDGRRVAVVLPGGTCRGRNVVLDRIAFTFRRTRAVEPWSVGEGSVASISTRLCYTVHRRDAKGALVRESPFTTRAGIRPEVRVHVLDYLERRTGLGGLAAGRFELGVEIVSQPPEVGRRHRVRFAGTVVLALRARVSDSVRFNRLAGEAIGQRRTYGFGAVSLDALEPATTRSTSCDEEGCAVASR